MRTTHPTSMRRRFFFLIPFALVAAEATAQSTTPALLDTIQHAAFKYFWFEANPSNGLIKDRSTSDSPCSIAATGFGLSAICIGVDHGWVTREEARDRVLTTLKTFWQKPQGSGDGYIGNFGLFYHWLDMTTATRTWNSELSTIDTGLLLAGILDAKQYFTETDSVEQLIRALADSIYQRMNWDLMRNHNSGIVMQWTPTNGFEGQWVGYNEASIMYILALGSPTFPVDYSAWVTWTQGYSWATYYGQTYVIFPPLFGHQYSHCWIDYRSIADSYMRGKGITYFENSRRATLAQRAYCIANPGRHVGYSDSLWGITASDVPTGYSARGAPPAQNDDGTITPTAPASSIPFSPEVVIPVLRNMWNSYRAQLWGQYGLRDAFNLDVNWWDTDVLGIDQGPIIIMIENYLNQRVWNRFMKNPDVQRGLALAGFQPVTGVKETPAVPVSFGLAQNYPNPFNPLTIIKYTVGGNRGQGIGLSRVSLVVYDILGREVAVLVNENKAPGSYEVSFDGSGLASGVYFYRLTVASFVQTRRMMLMK
jgi:hypothetical protein